MKIINNVNFNKKQLKNAVIEQLSAAPSTVSSVKGQIYYNDGSVTPANEGFYIFNGTSWVELTNQKMTAAEILTALKTVHGEGSGLDADLLDGNSSAYYAPINSPVFQGTPSAPTAPVGTNTTQLATTAFVKTAVENAIEGLDVKESVAYGTKDAIPSVVYDGSGNGSLTSAWTESELANYIDFNTGSGLTLNTRILIKNQTDLKQNGIYRIVSINGKDGGTSTVFTRVDDMKHGSILNPNSFTFIGTGSTGTDSLADTGWVMTFPNTPSSSLTVGGDNNTWVQFSSAGTIQAGLGLTKTGNVLSVTGLDALSTVARKRTFTITGNGTAQVFTLLHNFDTEDIVYSVHETVGEKEAVLVGGKPLSVSSYQIVFGEVVPSGVQYKVTLIG